MNGFRVSRRALVRVLGVGSLAFGLLGVASPATLGRMMDAEDETARAIGYRDIGSGLALLGGGGSAAIVQRLLYDVSDAISLARTKPLGAAAALGFAGLCALALASE